MRWHEIWLLRLLPRPRLWSGTLCVPAWVAHSFTRLIYDEKDAWEAESEQSGLTIALARTPRNVFDRWAILDDIHTFLFLPNLTF